MRRLRSLVNLKTDESYHKRVDTIADGLHPDDDNFPWEKLREYTDACIKKQKGITIPEGLDLFLISFIQKHPTKDVAVASVAHALSTEATLSLLKSTLKINPGDFDKLPQFVRILVAINHVNPTAVNDLDAGRARALLPVLPLIQSKPSRALELLARLFIQGVPEKSILAQHIEALTKRTCTRLYADMVVYREQSRWSKAYKAISWLSELPGALPLPQPENISLDGILDDIFPSWRLWAAWRPDKGLLKLFADKLEDADRSVLQGVLALEGPSRLSSNHPTLKEEHLNWVWETDTKYLKDTSFEIRFSSSEPAHVRAVMKSLDDRLLQALTAVVSTDNSWIQLFKQICVGKPILEDNLELLEICFGLGSSPLIRDVTTLLQCEQYSVEPPLACIVHMISGLDIASCQILRPYLGTQVLNAALNIFKTKQNHLRAVINIDRAWTDRDLVSLRELYGFGKALESSSWVMAAVEPAVSSLLVQWPFMGQIQNCYTIRMQAQSLTPHPATGVTHDVGSYVLERLVQPGTMKSSNFQMMQSLLSFWRKKSDDDRHTVAIHIAQRNSLICDIRCRCIDQLHLLDLALVKDLRLFLEGQFSTPAESCIVLAQSLVSSEESEVLDCWWPLLLDSMEEQGETLLQYALQNLGVDAWLQFMDNIDTVFTSRVDLDSDIRSPFLQPSFRRWALRLSQDLGAIKRLEKTKAMAFSPAMQCILRGGSSELESDLEIIISYLSNTYDESRWCAMQSVTARLQKDGSNSMLIRKSMSFLRSATPDGAEACSHVLETYEEVSLSVAETMLAAWYNDPDLMPYDKQALEVVAEILDIDQDDVSLPALESVQAADTYLEEQLEELLAEARRLESLRVAFKSNDPEWIAVMLQQLGIEDSSPLDDLFENLPTDLVDVVERIGENEVELHFPLATLSSLQKKAMGAGLAQSLLVRFIPPSGGFPPGFCIHFDTDSRDMMDTSGHFPWLVFDDTDPEEAYCHGRLTPAVFQLSRTLSTYLTINGFTTLQGVYTFLAGEIASLSSKCIVCSIAHAANVNIRRSTLCSDAKCKVIFDRACLDVQLSDIRADPASVDLLLTAVYATAVAGDLTLIPGCPIQGPALLKQMINALPQISQLQSAESLQTVLRLRGSGDRSAELLAWACTGYRGFLSSVTDSMKIPSFPGSHQFVLANASPELESNFAARVGRGTTRVMFHGTTLDRLHSILSQGLKDLSGTTLQRHGHSYGKGVYVASDPSTAWGYATNGTTSWSGSKFSNYRVLLGCELAGTWAAASGNIHVITDPSCLMVRFVFLLPNNSQMPLVQHVTPAMLSVFTSLRSGAL